MGRFDSRHDDERRRAFRSSCKTFDSFALMARILRAERTHGRDALSADQWVGES